MVLRGNSRRCTQESFLVSLEPYRMLGFKCGLAKYKASTLPAAILSLQPKWV